MILIADCQSNRLLILPGAACSDGSSYAPAGLGSGKEGLPIVVIARRLRTEPLESPELTCDSEGSGDLNVSTASWGRGARAGRGLWSNGEPHHLRSGCSQGFSNSNRLMVGGSGERGECRASEAMPHLPLQQPTAREG